MKQSEDNKFIPMISLSAGDGRQVFSDVFYYTNQMVNVVMLGTLENWVLVDAGMPKSGKRLLKVAEDRFGKDNPPKCIVLTHGHFDHVGGITYLLKKWQVPVYAHPAEFPFLSGKAPYPKPDPSVEGGLLAKISWLYPYRPIDISEFLQPLPLDSSIPHLDGWQWIATPGHSPGHISLFRNTDRILISGDALITVRQDAFCKVFMQRTELAGPPRYMTTDWEAAYHSVEKLKSLKPSILIAGHGQVMFGEEMRSQLDWLHLYFDVLAKPKYGKYVAYPTKI